MRTTISETDRQTILDAIDAYPGLTCPVDTADWALSIAAERGLAAGLAEVRRSIAYDRGETRDGVGTWTE